MSKYTILWGKEIFDWTCFFNVVKGKYYEEYEDEC